MWGFSFFFNSGFLLQLHCYQKIISVFLNMIFALSPVSSLNFEIFVLEKNVFPAIAWCGVKFVKYMVRIFCILTESLVPCYITYLFEVSFLQTAEVFHSLCLTQQSQNFVFRPFTFNVNLEFKPAILLFVLCFFSLLIFCSYVFSLLLECIYIFLKTLFFRAVLSSQN